jgi:hypothetical protein
MWMMRGDMAHDNRATGPIRERMWPTFSACSQKWVNEGRVIVMFQW